MVRIDAAARPDLIDQRVTMDRRTREVRAVGQFSFLSDYGDVDAVKSCRYQHLLDRIDLMAGERHIVELRWVDREKALRHCVRDAAERIVAVRIPDAEQMASAWREGTARFGKGGGLVRK